MVKIKSELKIVRYIGKAISVKFHVLIAAKLVSVQNNPVV
jgi:hypothetical protein